METPHIFQLVPILLWFIQTVSSFDSYPYLIDYMSPEDLNFQRGDVIACRIRSSLGSRFYGAEHVMLATSSSSIANIEADGKGYSNGVLREEDFLQMTQSLGYRACRDATAQYDRVMFEKGISPRRDVDAVGSARYWINTKNGNPVYYDFTGCNCQHWVTEWKYEKAWSVQSNQPPNGRCAMRNQFSVRPEGQATAYANRGQVGARADATVGRASGGSGVFSGVAQGPSVGVHAEAGVQQTGVGFKASVGEIRGNVGNSFGASLGLAADTGVGCGADGCGAQVLGTGIVSSRSKGTKICLFGSCLYFG